MLQQHKLNSAKKAEIIVKLNNSNKKSGTKFSEVISKANSTWKMLGNLETCHLNVVQKV